MTICVRTTYTSSLMVHLIDMIKRFFFLDSLIFILTDISTALGAYVCYVFLQIYTHMTYTYINVCKYISTPTLISI